MTGGQPIDSRLFAAVSLVQSAMRDPVPAIAETTSVASAHKSLIDRLTRSLIGQWTSCIVRLDPGQCVIVTRR
jgi:hypothetical protein